jgi:hypothetical protein
METVLKPFLSRFSQPVILSFCIAWIFWNWEIVVGLIWYNATTLPKYTAYKNYKELIEANAIWQRNYLYPMLVAVVYPYLRFGINYFNTVLETEETTQTLSASGEGKMSTLKFLELKNSYDEKVAALSEYFEEQSEIQKRSNEKDTAIINTKNELQKAIEEVQKVKEEVKQAKEIVEDLRYKEIVRTDDIHAAQMTVRELEEKSLLSFLISEYMVNISQWEGGNILNSNNSFCSISKNENQYTFNMDGHDIAVVSHYFYNITNDTFIIFLEQDKDSIVLYNRYLVFKVDNINRSFSTSFIYENREYKIKLDKM